MEKLYIIRVVSTHELYAWTQDKQLANKFVSMRKPGYFKITKKKFDDSDPVELFELGRFRSMYHNNLIFMNVLGGTNDTIDFPTTYDENLKVQEKCDKIFDELIDLSRQICAYPLVDKLRDAIECLSWYAVKDGGKNIYCDTFVIFMQLYGSTVI